MHPDRWANIVTQWIPQDGHRRRGRPRKRWRDDLDAYNPERWEVSKDRQVWRRSVEAFAQQWDRRNLMIPRTQMTKFSRA
ncbi:hypothetical protein B5X24_HaOG201800 [Helicoverpa armigera]|nr:hypothetical protein B5X24_HaOG201800 [Helicoverpa armigera]